MVIFIFFPLGCGCFLSLLFLDLHCIIPTYDVNQLLLFCYMYIKLLPINIDPLAYIYLHFYPFTFFFFTHFSLMLMLYFFFFGTFTQFLGK